MATNLKVQMFSTEPGYFEAGMMDIAKATKTAAEALKAHAPVQLDEESGKIKPIKTGEEAKVYGIVPEEAEAEKETVVYLTGEFFADSLALESDVTAAKLEVPMRNIGIFLKNVKPDP